jgi:hypothetical protein
MRRLLAALFVAALPATACLALESQGLFQCSTDADCDSGHACKHFAANPPDGHVYHCVDRLYCQIDSDCDNLGYYWTCNGDVCQPPECTQNSDCGNARICFGGRCEP